MDDDGTLLAAGWARRDVFLFDRTKVQRRWLKEWEFYQIANENYMALFAVATAARLAGYCSLTLIDLKQGKTLAAPMQFFGGANKKNLLSLRCDEPSEVKLRLKNAVFEIITEENSRTLYAKLKDVECKFKMDIMDGLENITTVLPFKNEPKRFFMTTKQNCMPTEGYFKIGNEEYKFTKEQNTFTTLDWGRVNAPRKLVWYWGNASTYLTDADGKKHLFGFEITWAIGDESRATETCLFYDGKAHKFGAVDVEVFPKPDKYLKPWHFVSEDGRFDMTMTPYFDNHSHLKVPRVFSMNCHQAHGLYSGTAILDDGTKVEIKDVYGFCEYCENTW